MIIVGKVIAIVPSDENKLAFIDVEEVIKGKIEYETIRVFFYGPKPGGNITSVDGEVRVLQFEKGERVLLFLYKTNDNYLNVANLDHGKIEIIDNIVRIPFLYRRNDKLSEVKTKDDMIKIIKSYEK